MCIAIYQPEGIRLSDDVLKNSFDNNEDGAGFAYINTDYHGVRRIKAYKTLDFESFKRQYERAIKIAPDSPFLVHFRIKTHGEISTFNCHPFKIDDDHVFMHNGIIPGMSVDKVKSDTQMFNEDYLKHLDGDWMFNKGIHAMIENIISMSKVVVMNIDGDVQIYNESKGSWKDGIWFSNDSYKKRKTYFSSKKYNYNSNRNYVPSSNYQDLVEKRRKLAEVAAKELDNQESDLQMNEESFIECDGCGSYFPIKKLHPYLRIEDPAGYCSTCQRKVILMKQIFPSDRISTMLFLELLNEEEPDTEEVSPHLLEVGEVIEDWTGSSDYPGQYDHLMN